MDIEKALEQATNRIVILEQQLAQWQKSALTGLTPEQLAESAYRQQIETLTYHLIKCREQVDNLGEQLGQLKNAIDDEKKGKEQAFTEINNLHKELDIKEQIIEKLKQITELKKQIDMEESKAAATLPAIPQQMQQPAVSYRIQQQQLSVGPITRPKKPKTIRDLLDVMTHIERIKLLDASILLDIDPAEIMSWSLKLQKKGFVVIEGTKPEKATLFASDRLRRMR
jgi:chromosome segregation ATPase